MVKLKILSENYDWTGTFEDIRSAKAWVDSNSLWVDALSSSKQQVKGVRFRYDGSEIIPEYLVTNAVPGKLYIIMMWEYVQRGRDVYPVLRAVWAKQSPA
jgi:hypothetical protein